MKAAFAASFDPITMGHVDLIERTADKFDEVVVLVAKNSEKDSLFSTRQRLLWVQEALAHLDNVSVELCEGLSTEAAVKAGASVMVRGLRNGQDLLYEQNIAWLNARICPQLDTFFLCCAPQYSYLSSSSVRELLKYGQSIQGLVPQGVFEVLQPALAGKETV